MNRKLEMDSTFMYTAIASGEVDVISAFSSDGRIAAFDLVVLTDTEQVIPPYDAIVLVSAAAAEDPYLVEALRGLINGVSVEAMRQANYMVDRNEDKKSVAEAARWLAKQVGGE
jgi:osmoprotectant transport system permease protein